MKQSEKVLSALKDAGPRGVHTFELRAEFIGNPSQRIKELEQQGYVISHTRERPAKDRAYGVRYRLVSEPGDTAPAYDDEGAPLLFDASVGSPAPLGAYDESEAA